jgi:rod shape-determining protein MreB
MATVGLSLPAGLQDAGILQRIRSLWSASDLAMDLGTANTLIYLRGYGVVVNEPSMVAIEEHSGKPLAVGVDAKRMFGKTSQAVRCVRPMKDGVIADFAITTLMIKHMLAQVQHGWSIRRPRIVIGVPPEITQVEKRAVIDAALASGCGEVHLVEEPMAAALGLDLPVDKPFGNMVVDIGGGTTDVAVISMNSTLYSHSIRVAGDEMDEAIQRHLQRSLGLQVGIFEAERVKLLIGSAAPFGQARSATVFGRDLQTGRPKSLEINDHFVREALEEPISAIIASVHTALEQTGPEVAHDIAARGIYLAGGGSLLKGLAQRLEQETHIRFHRAHDPLSCVVRGVGKILESLKEMRVLCIAG